MMKEVKIYFYRYVIFVVENGVNNDICVFDYGINMVVVVNYEGKF